MKDLRAVILAPLLVSLVAPAAAEKKPVPTLTDEHWTASKTVQFKTPAGWTVENTRGDFEQSEARGDGMILRVLRREGEQSLDAMHVECMLVRLAGPMEIRPGADYEYDFIGGNIGGRRALDSAFVLEYDAPIDGENKWRQRNLTVVGGGESLCIVTYAKNSLWKKHTWARKLLTSLAESVKWP